MENASKALLIAGSVLIAIVLIAVGLKILGSTSGVTKQVDTVSKTMEASTFNSMFSQYTGGTISGTRINSLISLVLSSNASNNKHKIKIITGSLNNQDIRTSEL